MKYMESLEKQANLVTTENNDTAYATTGSYCLDLFALIGGMRYNYQDIVNCFVRAFNEDRLLAIKILFFTRDIRGGLGERNSFRIMFNFLCNFYPEIAKQLVPYIPKYGRYDDMLVALNTNVESDVINYIKTQLEIDIKNNEEGKNVSLLAKWLPSINTSSEVARKLAKTLIQKLGMTAEGYRKTLSCLRKGRIIENNLREKDYTFDYSKQPSQAMRKYIQAFIRNDKERYEKFLEAVRSGEKKINTDTLYPYQIVAPIIMGGKMNKTQKDALDVTWKGLKRSEFASRTIVVRDGSGSMYGYGGADSPICIATSLAILFAEQLAEPYKNKFITFSERPVLVEIKGDTIYDKVRHVMTYDEVANTNISRVYKLLLDVAVNNNLPKEEMIDRIIIISDMEFDECVEGISTFETAKKAFSEAGYDLPEVVFWNVAARNAHLPVSKNDNAKLVSGASSKIFDMVVSGNLENPYNFMLEVLKKYSEFDALNLE